MTEKIWQVERGSYSDYEVGPCFASRELAEKWCTVDRDSWEAVERDLVTAPSDIVTWVDVQALTVVTTCDHDVSADEITVTSSRSAVVRGSEPRRVDRPKIHTYAINKDRTRVSAGAEGPVENQKSLRVACKKVVADEVARRSQPGGRS